MKYTSIIDHACLKIALCVGVTGSDHHSRQHQSDIAASHLIQNLHYIADVGTIGTAILQNDIIEQQIYKTKTQTSAELGIQLYLSLQKNM